MRVFLDRLYLFSGYLAGRAWSLMRRAVRLPHTEL